MNRQSLTSPAKFYRPYRPLKRFQMSRTPRVPGFKKAQPSSKPTKRHQQPDDYKNQFLSEINSCLKDTEYLTPNRRPQVPEPAKRQSQIPKRSSAGKKSMIPTPKRAQRQEIVPLTDTDVNQVFELEISSESPSPRKVPRRTPEPQRKIGTPTSRIGRAFSPARRPNSTRKVEAPRTKDDSDVIRVRREPGVGSVRPRRRWAEEEEVQEREEPPPPPSPPKKTQLVVSDLIVFSDSPEKDESVGNLIDLSPVAERAQPPPVSGDLVALMEAQPQTYSQPPSGDLLDLLMLDAARDKASAQTGDEKKDSLLDIDPVEEKIDQKKDSLLDIETLDEKNEEKKDSLLDIDAVEEKKDGLLDIEARDEKKDGLLDIDAVEEKKDGLLDIEAVEEKKESSLQEPSDALIQKQEESEGVQKENEPVSVQELIHSILGLPTETGIQKEEENEDAIFAFQERLCSIIEVEIVSQDGKRTTVFPTKLNEYLHNKTAACPETPAKVPSPEVKTKEFVSDSEDWVAVAKVESPTSERNSPQMSFSRSSEDMQSSPLSGHGGRSSTEIPLTTPRTRRVPKRPGFSSSPSDFSASAGSDMESAVSPSDKSNTPSPLQSRTETPYWQSPASPPETPSESPSPYGAKMESESLPPESPASESAPPSPEVIEDEPTAKPRKGTPLRNREQRKSWMPSPRKSPISFSKGEAEEERGKGAGKKIHADPQPPQRATSRITPQTPEKSPQRIPRKSPQRPVKKLLDTQEESIEEGRGKIQKVSPRIPKKSPQKKPVARNQDEPESPEKVESIPKSPQRIAKKSPAKAIKKPRYEESPESESDTPERRFREFPKSPQRIVNTKNTKKGRQQEAQLSSENSEVETPEQISRTPQQRIASKSPLRRPTAKKSPEVVQTRSEASKPRVEAKSPGRVPKKGTKAAAEKEHLSEHAPQKKVNSIEAQELSGTDEIEKPSPKVQKKSPQPNVTKAETPKKQKEPISKKQDTTPKPEPKGTPQMKLTPKQANHEPSKPAESPSASGSPSKPLPFNFNLKEMQKMFQSPPREVPKPPPPSPQRKTLASALIRADSSDYSD